MRTRTWLAVISTLYVISLVLPALKPWPSHEGLRGVACLLLGVVYPLAGFPAWWANPVLFVGCAALARGNFRRGAWCGLIAAPLAASFVVPFGLSSARIGSIVWVASAVALAVAGIERLRWAARSKWEVVSKSGHRVQCP